MKKNFSNKEIKIIFKDLDTLCKNEISLHKDLARIDNEDYYKLCMTDEQKAFIRGLEQIRIYVIKQYYKNCVNTLEEGEFLIEGSLKNILKR
jgi:hypothetical protein